MGYFLNSSNKIYTSSDVAFLIVLSNMNSDCFAQRSEICVLKDVELYTALQNFLENT